jgi:segregation and condensation protein B
MLNDDILKALLEGIIYVAPEPVTLDGMVKVLEGEDRERVKSKLDELLAEYEQNSHGIQIRQVANGYKFSTKAEHHEVLRKYVKNLKPLVRLSKPALETLAVIAYRQPVTMPEIEEIRGVDSGGVIHTLLEKKLVVTSGRKSVVGRPILYRTSKDFLVHFGLKDVGELPSLKEFEELAKRALGAEWKGAEVPEVTNESAASGEQSGAEATATAPETPQQVPPSIEGTSAPTDLPATTAAEAGSEPLASATAEPTQPELERMGTEATMAEEPSASCIDVIPASVQETASASVAETAEQENTEPPAPGTQTAEPRTPVESSDAASATIEQSSDLPSVPKDDDPQR